MNISLFARIRNAKPLIMSEEKRVIHFPKTGKVRIDNNVNYEPKYRQVSEKASYEEFNKANEVAALPQRITPPVSGYTERGNLHSYTQGYGGQPIKLNSMTPKEQYKLGSQIGRQQNALRQNNLGHTDLHSGNIVKPNPNKRKAYLIDNASFEPINDFYDEQLLKNLTHKKELGKPFLTGYNTKIAFTNSNKQMKHFANFALNALATQGALNGLKVGATTGTILGTLKGAGVGESEEEKANTTALGRVGKVVGGYLGGKVVGGLAGGALGAGAGYGYGKLRRNNQAFDNWARNNNLMSEKEATSKLTRARAKYYRTTGKPFPSYGRKQTTKQTYDPYENPARKAGEKPTSINIEDDNTPPNFQRETNRIWSTPKKPDNDNNNDWSNVPRGWS